MTIYVQGRIHFKGDNEPYGQLILMPGMGPVSWTITKKYHMSTLHGGSNHALLNQCQEKMLQLNSLS